MNDVAEEIVVGIEGSEPSRRAVDQAVRIGQRTGRTVHLVHAWETPADSGLGTGYLYDVVAGREAAAATATNLLDQEALGALERRRSALPVTLRATAHEGRIGPALVEASHDAYLLAVGTRGRGRLGNAFLTWLGDVMHHAPCPVLVVPPDVTEAAPFRKVVVGLDDSPASSAALRWAHELALCDGAQVAAVHVVPPNAPPVAMRDLLAWREHLSAALPGIDASTCDVALARGRADKALAQHVGPHDLLVVGSRGAGSISGLVLGSVSAGCLAHPVSPVLVVHAHEAPASLVLSSAAGGALRDLGP
jgi:nucleotide-binding universal stress UspA family protein